jgi:hypothetical protein
VVDEFRANEMEFGIDLDFGRGDEFFDCDFSSADCAGDEAWGFGVLLGVGMFGWVGPLGLGPEGRFGWEFFGEEMGMGGGFVIIVRRRLNLGGTFTF